MNHYRIFAQKVEAHFRDGLHFSINAVADPTITRACIMTGTRSSVFVIQILMLPSFKKIPRNGITASRRIASTSPQAH